MERPPEHLVKFYLMPQTWYSRLFAALLGALLFILLIFFFTLFLIVFAFLAVALTIYMLLFGRKPQQAASPNFIRVEYSLAHPAEDPENPDQPKKIPPPEE